MRKQSLFTGLLALVFLFSCSKDFEEINKNPNAPLEADPSLLLRQIIYNYGDEMAYEGFVAGNLLSQNFSMVDFNLFDRHALAQPQLGGNPWPIIYRNLRDNEILLQKSRSSAIFKVYEGPALVLKAYMAAALSDIYGDVPYFEAFRGKEGITQASYDKQEAIYKNSGGILNNLDLAIASLSAYSGQRSLEGDFLFKGDLTAWIKFANTLKIKYLMRISGRENVAAQLQLIYGSGAYISLPAENATFDFNAGPPNNFRMANLRSGDFNLYVMSLTSEQILKGLSDPRIGVFFKPAANSPAGQENYKGILNGPDASQTSISIADYSLAGAIFRENTALLDANFICSWESNFLLAEAAQKGLISANAQDLYERAVRQAFDYWGASMPSSYLTSDSAAFGLNGADPLEQIATQKWIANSINGYENWIEFRRTGFPKLKQVSASLNGGLIPLRMPYPPDEQALNAVNYNLAAASTNGNSINVKTWWDNN